MKSVNDFSKMRKEGDLIVMVTCYDYTSAKIVNDTEVDLVLVGDSAAMVMHGYESTIDATVEMMVGHVSAVRRGLPDKFLVGDMPFLAHRKGTSQAMDAVGAIMRAGANAVKIEGAADLALIRHIVDSGIPVMGHLGLTPQSYNQLGGYRVQGRDEVTALRLKEDAQKLEEAGSFALVLELVPKELAGEITDGLTIPTVGIGAGALTSGQVLVYHDVLGMNPSFKPRFLRKYLDGYEAIRDALNRYAVDVRSGHFPSDSESFV